MSPPAANVPNRRIAVSWSLLLAVVPLYGCAATPSPNSAWSQAARPRPVTTAGSFAVAPAATAGQPASMPGGSTDPQAPGFASVSSTSAPQAASSQAPRPTIRLVSQESSVEAQEPAQSPANPRVEFVSTESMVPDKAPLRRVLHASEATFEQQVLRSESPVLVDFYATWCGPCKALAPTLDELAAETPHAKVVKIDIDDSPELAARYGVKSIPSLMVFKDGQIVARHKGVVSKARLKAMLDP